VGGVVVNDAVRDADRRLGDAVAAVRSVDRDALPDEIADDVQRAAIAILAAKGNCEVRQTEVAE
jgi:hypothetical protein